jgi:hypothetical protein
VRKRTVKSVKDELIKKSREAMLAAVQIYNNPQITFKTETFITLAIIAWTYLMHSYYRTKDIDYLYYEIQGTRKRYHKTKNGAKKHWELERCINCESCPLDSATKNNLRFLIGIRHEIEHQMTNKIDEFLSAKLQACAMNYDYYLHELFEDKYDISSELSLAIQFSSISPEQEKLLNNNKRIVSNVKNFIVTFEESLNEDDIKNLRYAYRVVYVPISVNRKGQADKVIEFIKSDSEIAKGLEKHYTLIKETERKKYLPSEIVKIMKEEGFEKFSIHYHTELWRSNKAKDSNKYCGVKISKTWYWYDSWLQEVRKHCRENKEKYQ